jgi:hypothetical protein
LQCALIAHHKAAQLDRVELICCSPTMRGLCMTANNSPTYFRICYMHVHPLRQQHAVGAVSKCNDLKLEYPPNTSATSLVKLSLDEVARETLTFIRVLDVDSSEVSVPFSILALH